MTPREEGTVAAGHTKLYLRYCRTHETPRAPEDTRTRGGVEWAASRKDPTQLTH
jgi:hypothetical protein